MGDAMGYAARMTIGGNAVEFISADVAEMIDIIEDEGIRGTRSHTLERLAFGNIHVGGSVLFEPTPAELAFLLPLVTGSSTTAVLLTDALADVTVVIDTVTKLYTFVVRASAAHFSGEPGKKIQLKIDFVGKTLVVGNGGSLSAAPDITARPYVFTDAGSGITIGGSAYNIDKFELSIDNKIEPTFMGFSRSATDLEPTDRVVTLSVQTKYTSTEKGLLDLTQAGPVIASPLSASLAFTNSVTSNVVSFSFAALVAQSKSVVIPNKKHLRLPLNYRSYKASTTLETVPSLT